MDKAEYQEILEQIQDCVNKKDYKNAYKLAKSVDWRRVKSFRTLNMIADIYEINKDYEDCRKVLLIAKSRASVGKGILYRLVEVSVKLGDVQDAEEYFEEYSKIAPNDNGRVLLKYQIAKAKNAPIEEQIEILEEYKDREYTEKWTYELALLYSKAGNKKKCVDICDDMILWFSEGKYVLRAIELKKRYAELTKEQMEYYNKEQRDSDPRMLYMGDAGFAAGIVAKAAPQEAPKVENNIEEMIQADVKAREKKNSSSVMERMEAAGAKLTKDVDYEETSVVQLSPEEIDKLTVTSPLFMGGTANLQVQLEKSKESVIDTDADAADKEDAKAKSPDLKDEAQPENTDEENKKDEETSAEDAAENTAKAPVREYWMCECGTENYGKFCTDCGKVKPEGVEIIKEAREYWTCKCGAENYGKFCTECGRTKPQSEPEKAEEKGSESGFVIKKDAPAPTFPSDWEIPDPEESKEERITHTIPLDKIGQNTVPISIEEVMRNETPEERRIRILNNATSTKMNDEQRQIFTYFARIPGMDSQILESVTAVYRYAGEHTSKRGNIAVMGAAGTGKTRLTYGLIVMMAKDMGLEAVKTARFSGEQMNELDPAVIVGKMAGGFLVIENAGDMQPTTIANLNKAMEFKTDCMIVIIEDEKNAIRGLFRRAPEFAEKFTGSISIPAFTNDELVTFARTYCAENNAELDEMGVLALYTLISNNQTEEQPVNITQVKSMVDGAISHAKRTGRKGRRGTKGKIITLYEKDFIV